MKYSLKEEFSSLFKNINQDFTINYFVNLVTEILNNNSKTIDIKLDVDGQVKTMQKEFSYNLIIDYSYFLLCENQIDLNDFESKFDEEINLNADAAVNTDIQIPEPEQIPGPEVAQISANKIFKGQKLIENNSNNKQQIVQFLNKYFKKGGKIEGYETKLVGATTLNSFKARLFYFLYKKFYKEDLKLNPQEPVRGRSISEDVEDIVEYFLEKLQSPAQKCLTVNFGSIFEEFFREEAFKIINSSTETFTVDLNHNSRKIALVILYCCNGLFTERKSAVYDKLKDSRNISNKDYETDFFNVKFQDGALLETLERSPILTREVKKIISQYESQLGLNRSNTYLNDLELDPEFDVEKNCPFDFIIRDKNINETNSNVGLFDLKATNHDSKSKPIQKASTGSNGGTSNSGLVFVNRLIKQLNKKNTNIGIEFFSLIQIEYKLDFNDKNNYQISIINVQNIIAPAATSFNFTTDKDHFYLSYNDDYRQNYQFANIKVEDTPEVIERKLNNAKLNNKDIDDLIMNKGIFKLNVLKQEQPVTQVKTRKIGRLVKSFLQFLNYLYTNSTDVESCIKDHTKIHYLNFITKHYYFPIISDVNTLDYSEFTEKYKLNSELSESIFDKAKNDKYFDPEELVKYLYGFVVNGNPGGYSSIRSRLGTLKDIYRKKITNILVSPYGNLNRRDNLQDFFEDCDSSAVATNDASIHSRLKNEIRVDKIINKIKFWLALNSSPSSDAQQQSQNSSYVPQGKVLREVYSYLFKKKIINEGGLAGHMMHPYEALDMTPRQIIDRIKEYSASQKIIEKVDGQNLFFTVEQDGTLMFARNKEDMTHNDLVEKFTNHPAEVPFVTGGNAIKKGVDQWLSSAGAFGSQEILDIFHPDGEARSFINFEIMHKDHPNQLEYGENFIVFHSIVDFINGREAVYSSNNSQRLNKLINLMKPGIESSDYTLASNRTVDINKLTNVQITHYVDRIKEIANQLDITETEFLGDGVEKQIKKQLDAEGITISDEAIKILYDFALYGEDRLGNKIKSKDFTKLMKPDDVKKLRAINLTNANKAAAKVRSILSPFKDVFVDLGIDLLDGTPSAYMDTETDLKNIDNLRDKLETAIDDLRMYMNSTPENEWDPVVNRLKPHYDKVVEAGVYNTISTSVEGGVYDYQGDLLKVTGGFAPMNQILGAAYRDKKGIFTTFKQKFMQQESNRRSLKSVFSSIF